VLDRIRRTGELRVGFLPDNPPFGYSNDDGALVGLEVDLLYRLAVELEADLRLVPYEPGSLDDAFASDHFDVAVGGMGSRVRQAEAYRESDPYMELHAAFVVPDHRTDEFGSLDDLRAMDRVSVGYVERGALVRTGRHRIPGVELVPLPSAESYLLGRVPEIDILLTTAEVGAIYSMTFPEYSVVVPEGLRVRIPVVLAIAPDDGFARTVNRFVQIKRADGTIETLHEHWILGAPSAARERRWSVVKDVFGWGE